MDFYHIIKQEGYRREDLTPQHREMMETLDFFRDKVIANLKNNMEMVDEDFDGDERPETIIAQAKWEYANHVIDKVLEWFDAYMAEFQVTIAEEEPEKEE